MNEEAKKKILRRIPSGLCVIGVKDAGGFHASTASWLSQCSLKPPRIMMGIRNGSRSLEAMRLEKVFSVNFFSKRDSKIVEHFFKPPPADGSRLGGYGFSVQKTGTPVLDLAIAYLECEVREVVDAGDHSIVLGEVVASEILKDEPPLIMSDTPWHYGG